MEYCTIPVESVWGPRQTLNDLADMLQKADVLSLFFHYPMVKNQKDFVFVDFLQDFPGNCFIGQTTLDMHYICAGEYSWLKMRETPVILLYQKDTDKFVTCKLESILIRVERKKFEIF